MKWTQTIPTKPGYYLEYTKFRHNEELYRLIQVYEDHQSHKMKVHISHFGSGHGRNILLSTFTTENNALPDAYVRSWFCKVNPPKQLTNE